ncbi:MAG TPA: hypothetical protein VGE07_25400 [Herpetosiphonaceae bacterium]
MNRARSTSRFQIGVVVLCLVGLIGGCAVVSLHPLLNVNDPFDDRPFDQALWLQQQNTFVRDNPRGLMAHELATLLETQRLTRAEVLALLGAADGESYDTMLSYELGMWSGFRMDHDTLDIYFDSTDRVEDARVVQH